MLRRWKLPLSAIQNLYFKEPEFLTCYFWIFHLVLLITNYHHIEKHILKRYKVLWHTWNTYYHKKKKKYKKIQNLYSIKRVWQISCWFKVWDKSVIAISEPTSFYTHLMPNISHLRRFKPVLNSNRVIFIQKYICNYTSSLD